MKCPKCDRKLIKVFQEADDELALESLKGEIIIGNCTSNYYCKYCDEFYLL